MVRTWVHTLRESERLHLDFETIGIRLGIAAVPNDAIDQFRAAHVALWYVDLGGGGGFPVDVDFVDRLRHIQIVWMFLEQAPAFVLCEEPHAVGQVREIGRAVFVKLHRVSVSPFFAVTVVVLAFPAIFDHFHRCVDVGLVSKNRRCFFLVSFLINEA